MAQSQYYGPQDYLTDPNAPWPVVVNPYAPGNQGTKWVFPNGSETSVGVVPMRPIGNYGTQASEEDALRLIAQNSAQRNSSFGWNTATTWADITPQQAQQAGVTVAPTSAKKRSGRRATTQAAPAAGQPIATQSSLTDNPPSVDTLSPSELAEQYGYAAAVLNSNSELQALFRQAVAGQWSTDRFTAKVRSTQWYKKHSESWRNTEILRLADPASYTQNWNQAKNRVVDLAASLGVQVGGRTLTNLVNSTYRLGWDDSTLRKNLANFIKFKNGVAGGQAGQTVRNLRAIARANGVTYNDQWYENAARGVIAGTRTGQDYENDIRTQAASAFPVFSEQIKAGQNVADIASPYIQRMGALLEINPEQIDLFDSSIREALSGRNPDTGKAEAKSLWQFENDLRKDPRWQKTKNAKETYSGLAEGVLKSWGLI